MGKTNGRKTVVMKDIADAVGASISAVSSVLNGRGRSRVSDETRKKILREVRRAGYVYRGQRKARPNGRLTVLVLSTFTPGSAYADEILRGIESALLPLKGRIVVSLSDAAIRAAAEGRDAHDDDLGGVIVVGPLSPPILELLMKRDLPVVMIGSSRFHDEVPMVYPDPVGYARLGIEHLRSLRHERIGLLLGPLPHYSYEVVKTVFIGESMGQSGALDPGLLGLIEHEEDAAPALRSMLDRRDPPTAIFGQLRGGRSIVQAMGLSIPDDLSMLSIDSPGDAHAAPLSYVGAHNRELGRQGLRALLELKEDPRGGVRHIILPVRVVDNGSCARRRGRAGQRRARRGAASWR